MRELTKRENPISTCEGISNGESYAATNLPECSRCRKKFSSKNELFQCKCAFLVCKSCLSEVLSCYHIQGKCHACAREEDFKLAISGDAIHTIYFNKFKLNGGPGWS